MGVTGMSRGRLGHRVAVSEQQPPAPGREATASNAETVVPARDGGGGAGTAGGRGEPDPSAVEEAGRHAELIETHNEAAGDDQGTRPSEAPRAGGGEA